MRNDGHGMSMRGDWGVRIIIPLTNSGRRRPVSIAPGSAHIRFAVADGTWISAIAPPGLVTPRRSSRLPARHQADYGGDPGRTAGARDVNSPSAKPASSGLGSAV